MQEMQYLDVSSLLYRRILKVMIEKRKDQNDFMVFY